MKPTADFVCVHDAARPCLTDAWIDEIFDAAEQTGAAIFAVPVTGTLKRVGGDKKIEETVPRERPLGGANAAGLPPPTAPGRLRPARRFRRHRRRAIGRAAGPPGDGGPRLADEPEDHAPRRTCAWRSRRLKALPKPKLAGPLHPFADDDKWR